MRAGWIAVYLAALATPVCAAGSLAKTSDGYTYFYKPGADIAAHDTDVRSCRHLADQMHQPDTDGPVYAPGLAGVLAVVIVKAGQAAVRDHTGRMVNVENCMVVKGWQVVLLDAAEGEQIGNLDQKAKAEKLQAWVGASSPHGTIVRTFANDAFLSETAMFEKAHHIAKTGVSTDAVLKDAPVAKDARPAAQGPAAEDRPEMPRSARPPAPLAAGSVAAVPANSALIVVNINGIGVRTLEFEREGRDSETPAWVDGRPASFVASQPAKAFAAVGATQGTTLVFAVPPGRWRLAGTSSSLFWVSYCMGSPAFEVGAGEVVYAGSFDPAGATMAPDMGLDPAKAAFSSLSGLADKVRAANYVNGSQGPCSGAYLYSLELPDHGFLDGYSLGSRAKHGASAPAAVPAAPAVVQAPPSSGH